MNIFFVIEGAIKSFFSVHKCECLQKKGSGKPSTWYTSLSLSLSRSLSFCASLCLYVCVLHGNVALNGFAPFQMEEIVENQRHHIGKWRHGIQNMAFRVRKRVVGGGGWCSE